MTGPPEPDEGGNMPRTMKALAGAVLLAALASLAGEALAQSYPTRAVRIIVPFAAGGRVDGLARIVANSLSEQLGQPFVVESRAGAGGSAGSDFVAKSAGDGYTLLLASAGTHAILPVIDRNLPYDPVRDFTPIANLVEGYTFIGAHPSLGATNLADLVRIARERPDSIGFATSGIGTYGHFAGELLKSSLGINLEHVPYRGSGPAMNDLIAGHVPLMIAGELVDLARAGRIRAIATTNERRSPELPDVPTIGESGMAPITVHSWIALVGPAGIPPEIVERINAAVGRAINDPRNLPQLQTLGVSPSFSTAAALGTRIATDRATYADIVRRANLRFEQ